MIDDGCTVEGYQSDITRTFVLGKADREDEQRLRHRQARRRPRRSRRRGPACRWRRSTRRRDKVVIDAGYGPGFKYFTPPRRPRHGHGRPRVAVPGEEQHVRVGPGADGAAAHGRSATSRASTSGASSACGSRTTCTSPRMARSFSRRSRRRSRAVLRREPGYLTRRDERPDLRDVHLFDRHAAADPPGRGTPGRSRSDLKPM